jgi:hypothetical protein
MVARGNTFGPGSKAQDLRNRCQPRQHFAAKLSDRKHSKPRNKKRRFHGVNHRNGVKVLPVGIQQREKHGTNHESVSAGAPGGATWGAIRDLIARCEDLPEGIRGQLVAAGDRCRMKLNKVPPNDVG